MCKSSRIATDASDSRSDLLSMRQAQVRVCAFENSCGGPCAHSECLHPNWRAFNACSERNRHQPAPLLAYTLESGIFLTRGRRIAVVGHQRSVDAMTQGRARQTNGRENGHDHFARHRLRCAAARRRWTLLQTQGLSRKGGWLAGIIRRLTAGAPLPWAVADRGAIGDRTCREVYDRRYLVKRLRAALPDVRILVGRWGPPALADDSTQVLRDTGANLVASTLLETRTYLAGLVEIPRIPVPETNVAHAA
jgi:hypothetical protein